MKSLPLLILLCVIWEVGSVQTIDDELTKLRDFLKVPASVSIVPSRSALPGGGSLRVYIATGDDNDLNKVFVRRISEWNKKNELKFGHLEVVPEISQAQVVLAWYSVRIEKVTQPPDDTPSDQRICCPERNYSYLLVRTENGFEILSRIIIEGYSSPSEADSRGNSLRGELFKRMKAR